MTAGGLRHSVSRRLSLDASLDATGGRFTEFAFDGAATDNVDTGLARVGFGPVIQPRPATGRAITRSRCTSRPTVNVFSPTVSKPQRS